MTDIEERELIHKTSNYVKSIIEKEPSGHDYFHIERVYLMACHLAKTVSCDETVVKLSALLHDLDDPKLVGENSHLASDYLQTTGISSEHIVLIENIIQNLSYSKHKAGKTVESLEGKIVQDADRLDAIGAIGIARAFQYGGFKGRPIFQNDFDDQSSLAHFYQKLLKLEALMNLEESKKIARERTEFMNLFLKQFFLEWNSKLAE